VLAAPANFMRTVAEVEDSEGSTMTASWPPSISMYPDPRAM